ncbi:MAG: SMP-30/gluconolactonase/LRE family protein [Solirubrobacterales bacterium]
MRGIPARFAAAFAATALGALGLATGASALEDCPTQPQPRVVDSSTGAFESIAFDSKGRLFYTRSGQGKLMMIARKGAKPKTVLDGIDGPGGIVFRRNGNVLVGYGDTIAQASDGEADPQAGLIEVDPKTGEHHVFIHGLQMANGVTRGPGGQIFASTDFGTGVDRILKGDVELGWAPLDSSNGMVVDSAKRNLFVNQTFTPIPTIAKIALDDPTGAQPWFTAPDEAGGFLDGLTRDADGTLYAAANGSGDVWRISGPDEGCVLYDGPPFPSGPSAVAFGRGQGRFPKGSLFVTTFGGQLLQLPHVR